MSYLACKFANTRTHTLKLVNTLKLAKTQTHYIACKLTSTYGSWHTHTHTLTHTHTQTHTSVVVPQPATVQTVPVSGSLYPRVAAFNCSVSTKGLNTWGTRKRRESVLVLHGWAALYVTCEECLALLVALFLSFMSSCFINLHPLTCIIFLKTARCLWCRHARYCAQLY